MAGVSAGTLLTATLALACAAVSALGVAWAETDGTLRRAAFALAWASVSTLGVGEAGALRRAALALAWASVSLMTFTGAAGWAVTAGAGLALGAGAACCTGAGEGLVWPFNSFILSRKAAWALA
ncbi:hypothetical protein SDC9_184411 [bioreactor metagenome]|uniref:Uncharacterized protein n=1 Tax=bioreactor metagenome TaxID=1076179 RepID=A0A645HFG2_9ZZZZ